MKSAKGLGVSDGHTDPKIGPQVYLGPIKKLGMKLKDQHFTSICVFRTINGFVVVKLNITCETDDLELEIRFRFVSRGVTRRGCWE